MTKVKLLTEALIDEIVPAMETASSIYILTSFAMKSGVERLAPSLKRAVERGAEVKVCTGDYLYVTQPQALQALIDVDESIEVRLWKSNGKSFHPKAYLFQRSDEVGLLIVGSSNLSRSALTHGVEWNLAMESTVAPATFEDALDQFMKVFYHEQTIPVNEETIATYQSAYERMHQQNPNLAKTWTETEELELMLPKVEHGQAEAVYEKRDSYEPLSPRPAQRQALDALRTTVEEGYDKAMVVMATGLGKTYLAGFFAQDYKRVLFVAHREEILRQAQESFKHIMPERSFGIYNGREKEGQADCVFASIFTLANQQHLHQFAKDRFDLIVIDEFHHAAAKTYQRVLDYFEPSFLLGITATPDRMDGKDVYGICGGNVAFQLHFIEAIQRQWLAPFHYYGVYDETDYSQVTWLGNRYDVEELLAVQLREEMAEKVFRAWQEHKQTRTLGFCSSIKQANFLANYFKNQGVKAVSLHSNGGEMSRGEAIKQIENKDLDVIFTVNLFNEGTDIPSLDTLLFVRPTESLTVFTQQIGRGLRLFNGKDHCTIIDLIGNYRNADIKLSLFDTRTEDERKKAKAVVEPQVPESCVLDLDVKAIDLLKELARKKQPRKERLRQAYIELKQELGRRPTYLELHLHGNVESRAYRQDFKSYVGFLHWAKELSDQEKDVYQHHTDWLQEVERTGMNKSYKMIVLLYMLERGIDSWTKPVTPTEIAPFFHRYLTEKEYRKQTDFSDKRTKKLWEYDETKVAKLIADMPMTKWSGGSKGLLSFTDGVLSLDFDIHDEDQELLYKWTKEICEYRLHEYFERKGNKPHQ
ncbi:DEAD/DEAH box helicase family protein [Desertibacillus haloalkaliphilus]|uniref:DEAD/DEAH box helicase family protein n=1 Tax=Desertibacillus haloalkaliphilus TaxID=1328930 RepID=UPI001C271984|nr:DEAD/DEAH box helicase family protein [Desertibacillus haloalkaliphilus]MBU8907676.1 DEAD/DEAH box helicase family protein [Desertibacillus haloalkaliphilus]